MAVACPVGLDAARLRDEVRSTCASVTLNPAGEFHFHRERTYLVPAMRAQETNP